jgi:hypothetical protein
MSRAKLPNRRHVITQEVKWGEHRFHVSVGYAPDTGAVSEVFYASGMKEGTDIHNTAQDACILVSMLLQHGVPARDIGKSLSSVSIISAVVGAVTA